MLVWKSALQARARNISFCNPELSVRLIALLFGLQQPTMICRATIDFVSITCSKSVVYKKVCAVSLHKVAYIILVMKTISLEVLTYFHVLSPHEYE
jgi:hypothetical protein